MEIIKIKQKDGSVKICQTINPYKLFFGSFIPNWLLCRKEIGLGAKVVYARLSQFAGENGKCFPSLETIADEIGTTRQCVINSINILLKNNLIYKKRRGLGKSNQYFFLKHNWMCFKDDEEIDVSEGSKANDTSGSKANDTSIVKQTIREYNHIKESINLIQGEKIKLNANAQQKEKIVSSALPTDKAFADDKDIISAQGESQTGGVPPPSAETGRLSAFPPSAELEDAIKQAEEEQSYTLRQLNNGTASFESFFAYYLPYDKRTNIDDLAYYIHDTQTLIEVSRRACQNTELSKEAKLKYLTMLQKRIEETPNIIKTGDDRQKAIDRIQNHLIHYDIIEAPPLVDDDKPKKLINDYYFVDKKPEEDFDEVFGEQSNKKSSETDSVFRKPKHIQKLKMAL